MGVDVRRGGKIAVPQPLLNVLEGNAVGQQQAGTAVTQIVKAHPAQAVALQKLRKRVGQVVHPHPLAQLVHEYKAVAFIVVAVAADLLVQLLRLFHLQKVFPEAAAHPHRSCPGVSPQRIASLMRSFLFREVVPSLAGSISFGGGDSILKVHRERESPQ